MNGFFHGMNGAVFGPSYGHCWFTSSQMAVAALPVPCRRIYHNMDKILLLGLVQTLQNTLLPIWTRQTHRNNSNDTELAITSCSIGLFGKRQQAPHSLRQHSQQAWTTHMIRADLPIRHLCHCISTFNAKWMIDTASNNKLVADQ